MRVGPTYSLELEPPPGVRLEDFRVALLGNWRRFSVHGSLQMDPVAPRIRPAPPGGSPWVRFTATYFAKVGMGQPWHLSAVSDDGFHWATGTVTAAGGVHPEPVPLELHAAGVVAGRVQAAEGGDPPRAVLALFWPAEEGPRNLLRPGTLRTATEPDGAFRLQGLEPGTYALMATASLYERQLQEIAIRPGEETRVEFRLVRQPAVGSIGGRLLTLSGDHDRPVRLELQHTGRGRETLILHREFAWTEEDGELVAPFRFDDLPAGTYRLRPVFDGSWLEWEPPELEASPGDLELELLGLDGAERHDLVYRARDAETGEPVPLIRAVLGVGGGATSKRHNLGPGDVALAGHPADQPLAWSVRARGYVPVYGGRDDFVPAGDGTAVAELRLKRGWGARFRALHARSYAPLEGVRILLDGEEAGTTDAGGWLAVERPERPRHLEAEKDGWGALPAIDYSPHTREFDDQVWTEIQITLLSFEEYRALMGE